MPITYPRYLRLATIGLLATAVVFVLLPYVLRFFDPSAGSFGIDTLNALAFGAVLLAAILNLAFIAYERVFPRFKTYQQESLEGDGKLFENLTDELESGLVYLRNWVHEADQLPVRVEARKIAQFKFLIRCVRLSFCLSALYYLVQLSEHVLIAALTVVPK
jgi:hypothetical protein